MSSRPSSRLSSSNYVNHETATAAGSLVGFRQPNGQDRTSSSLHTSLASAMTVPFTPGGGGGHRGRATRLGLSAQEFDKANEVIASVQRGARGLDAGRKDVEALNDGITRRRSREKARLADADGKSKGQAKVSAAPEGSFIAEASFVDAPIPLRVNSRASPRRPTRREPEILSTTRLRQIISNNDSLQDTEADLKSLDEYEQVVQGSDDDTLRDCIDGATLSVQEALLIEDLLSVLMGIEGQFITIDPACLAESHSERFHGPAFVIDECIDETLRHLANRILPLATYHGSIEMFVESHNHLDFGLTSHALCSAVRDVLRDYLILIAQLEDQFASSATFSLQRLYFYGQPLLHKLHLIYALIMDLTSSPSEGTTSVEGDGEGGSDEGGEESDEDDRFGGRALKEVMKDMRNEVPTNGKAERKGWSAGGPLKGGEILAVIEERLQKMGGDPIACSVYSTLLVRASQPYAHTLLRWINTGQLSDPYDEFMINESRSLHRTALDQDYVDEYWERKYTLKDTSPSSASDTAATDNINVLDGANLLDAMSLGASLDGKEATTGEKRASKRSRGLGGGGILPAFLEGWKVKILLAGKYLNVIRECGSGEPKEIINAQNALPPNAESVDEDIAMGSEAFQSRIDLAYLSANTALLRLLITQQSLFPRLRSLKNHFFLDQGDSFTHFLDLASHELGKKAKHVSLSKLQSLLDLAIRNPSSASGADPYKEDVKIAISGTTLTEWLTNINNVNGVVVGDDGDLPESNVVGANGEKDRKKEESDKSSLTGIDALSLDYTVKFPLSLIISRKAILKYQLIFRHLLSLKHLEQILTTTWLEHTKFQAWRKRTASPRVEKWKARVFTLRTRMLAFTQQMFAFAVSEVLEGNWRNMMIRLEKVKTVDQLLRYHNDFLDTCLKECMLTNNKLLKLQARLTQTCSLFVAYGNKFAKAAAKLNLAVDQAIANGDEANTVSVKEEDEFLQKFELNFYKHQKTHADTVMFHALSDTSALLALVVRLANTVPSADGPPV